MLTNMTNLANKIDGNYATDQELNFIDEYFEASIKRINVYEKIRDNEEKILNQLESEINNSFSKNLLRNYSSIWRRDVKLILQKMAVAILFNDLERLRNGVLIWHQTISKANNVINISNITYQSLKIVIKNYLTSEEIKLFMPALDLTESIFSC